MKKVFKSIWRFVLHYRMFSLAIVASLIGLALQLLGFDTVMAWVLGGTAAIVAVPMVIDMVRDLRNGTYGVDILAITAIATAIIMKEYWAAMVIILMLTGGEALEDYAENRAKREMTALLDNAPRHARIIRGKKILDVSVKKVQIGDKLLIRPGEVVAVDAEIIDGTTTIDQSSLTGESLPEEKTKGMEVLSGSVNIDGTITVRALRPAAESQYEQIVKLVRQAAASKAPFVRMADRFAIPFTIIAFAIAIGAWVLSGDSLRFLQVMVVATPCPLILAAPIAIISGMSRASKAGIIVKNGTALERLANARSVAFDKTGTLTLGRLHVASVEAFGKFKSDEVLAAAATLEKGSNHILAQAIVNHAEASKVTYPKVKQIKEVSGRGLIGTGQGKKFRVGRADYLQEEGIDVPTRAMNQGKSKTSTFVAIGDELAGVIMFEDEIRHDSRPTIEYLKSHGVEEVYLITGDNQTIAESVARSVGIDKKQVVASALPIDKLRTVERVAKPPVAFVGDGVNDAPVLVASDVGIALGARGSTAASESADVVIMKDSLSKVADVHGIAKRTFMIARQSILVGIGLSVVLMLVFATGKFAPVWGAAVQEVVDVIVIFNALRAHVAGHRQG